MPTCRSCTYTTEENVSICPNCGVRVEDEALRKSTQKLTLEMILMRKKLEYFLWCLGIIFPLAVSFMLRRYKLGLYIYIVLPSLPFICLALICRVSIRISDQSVIGALTSVLILYLGMAYWVALTPPCSLERNEHLIRCLVYIDPNMVRAGVARPYTLGEVFERLWPTFQPDSPNFNFSLP